MDKIEFRNVLPEVFASQHDLKSDVWKSCFELERGKIYLVEANSGKGKSTFCSYLIGYRNDYSGEILFNGVNVDNYTTKQWIDVRKKHISHLFQELRLFPELTALENIEIKNNLTNDATRQHILDWFQQLGILDKTNEKVGRMSFGQQQRVALVRALAQPYDFLVIDEPISHLDDDNAEIMSRILLEEVRRKNASLIVTSIGKHLPIEYDKTLKL